MSIPFPQMKEEEIVRQLATEIRILEGSVTTLQSRLEVVRSAISEVVMAHATLEGLTKLQEGDDTMIPVGSGSYLRMKIADSKKLVMGIGAGVAMEKDVVTSIEELKGRAQELEKARNSIQQQLDQTVARYEQDRETLDQLLRQQQGSAQQTAS
jgi:prefoldin alpha subunit